MMSKSKFKRLEIGLNGCIDHLFAEMEPSFLKNGKPTKKYEHFREVYAGMQKVSKLACKYLSDNIK